MKILRQYKTNGGAAMMILVLFFVFISLALLVGIVTPVVREFQIASANLESKQAYYLSESGLEDAMYRLNNNMQIGSTTTLTLGTSTATTVITNEPSGQKDITTIGTDNSHQRKVDLLLSTGTGVSFNYGVQVGQGGIDLTGSGQIVGNVYSNGPITGDSSAIITGSAISANSPAFIADQGNGTGVPPYNVSFGNAAATQEIAQSFQLATSSPLNTIQLYVKKVGTPSNDTLKIVADSGGSPGTTVIASGTLSASLVTTSYGWIDVTFSTNPTLAVGTTYWLIVDANTSKNNYYIIGATNGGYANGIGKIGSASSWGNTTPPGLDYYFNIYLGGVLGSIAGSSASQYNPLHIGTVSGTAQAHTVKYTNSTGLIYCQTGVGNNKSCTSATDPTYIGFPISNSNIAQWQSDATTGGIQNGSYTVPNGGTTLGPKKIVGDLTVSSGRTLTVSGVLWVTGNLTLDGNGVIQLGSGYGVNDGVILVDGTITIAGGGHATGSGITGSYIMFVTTSTSSAAASIAGGAGAVIVYAPNGTASLSGGAALKEITAYKISVSGGSTVTYESGLANNNFTSGPSGAWNVSSWQEIQ